MPCRDLKRFCLAPLALSITAAIAQGQPPSRAGIDGLGPMLSAGLDTPRSTSMLPVTSCADDGSPGTLRAVVATAVSGDVVDLTALSCGKITLVSGQIEIQVDELTVEGPGADSLTIDGSHAGDNYAIANGRVFEHNGSQDLTISNVTIANGLVYNRYQDAYGGCISAKGPVVMNNVVVTGCRAVTCSLGGNAEGGAIAAGRSGSAVPTGVSLTDSVVTGNEAIAKFCPQTGTYGRYSAGGGIMSRGTMTVTNSKVVDNQVRSYVPTGESNYPRQAAGGGIMAYFFPLTITGSVVSGNFAGCHTGTERCYGAVGAGIRSVGGLTIESSTVSENIAEGANAIGGGIELEDVLGQHATFQIDKSTISNNQGVNGTARNWGGGVEVGADAVVEISNTTIYGNAAGRGGGIDLDGAQLTLSNTTISGNTASDTGGGVFVQVFDYPLLALQNSTVTSNRSTSPLGGGGVVDGSGQNGATNLQSSIVAGNINDAPGATYDADLGVLTGAIEGANNLIVAASGVTLPPDTISTDPMLGPLQDNGGSTWTHALLSGSPAIDAGNNVQDLDFDQRGSGFPECRASPQILVHLRCSRLQAISSSLTASTVHSCKRNREPITPMGVIAAASRFLDGLRGAFSEPARCLFQSNGREQSSCRIGKWRSD